MRFAPTDKHADIPTVKLTDRQRQTDTVGAGGQADDGGRQAGKQTNGETDGDRPTVKQIECRQLGRRPTDRQIDARNR